ncbi:MAG: hypothetical protein RLZZ241_2628 [Bacteroidota bacterium]|jgi:phospholipase/carboxylesterase
MKVKALSLNHVIRPAISASEFPPVLFLMHGYGSDEADLFSFSEELPEDLFIISVQAPFQLQPYGYAWYAINFEAERGKWSNIDQAVSSREAMLKFIDEAIIAYKLNSTRVSLLGFSQGAILGYALVLSYPERFKTLIALSGYVDAKMLLPEYNSKNHQALQIYASHGQVDPVIPPIWAEQSAQFLKDKGLQHVFEQFPVGHGVCADNFMSFKNWMAGKY